MVCADIEKGTFMETAAISKMVATRQPYKQWLAGSLRRLSDLGESTFLNEPMYDAATMLKMQAAIGGWVVGVDASVIPSAYAFALRTGGGWEGGRGAAAIMLRIQAAVSGWVGGWMDGSPSSA